jgi:hypothetical protein
MAAVTDGGRGRVRGRRWGAGAGANRKTRMVSVKGTREGSKYTSSSLLLRLLIIRSAPSSSSLHQRVDPMVTVSGMGSMFFSDVCLAATHE